MLIQDLKENIGHTPLLKLNHLDLSSHVHLYAKLEYLNPLGSLKDRTGFSMVKDAQRKGLLHQGSTIIEPTAGNTGLGIAFAALNEGYHVIFCVPEKFSIEKQILMKALGAQIITTPFSKGMLGAREKANELVQEIDDAIILNQFENESNPYIHYQETGFEIYEDLPEITHFVGGAGTGGSYSGIMRYLKEKNQSIQGVLADPIGSIIGGGAHQDYKIEGIGNDFIAKTMSMEYVDKVIKVSDNNAFDATRLLARKEGIISGSSSGACFYAAMTLAKIVDKAHIVFPVYDRGERYFSHHLFDNNF